MSGASTTRHASQSSRSTRGGRDLGRRLGRRRLSHVGVSTFYCRIMDETEQPPFAASDMPTEWAVTLRGDCDACARSRRRPRAGSRSSPGRATTCCARSTSRSGAPIGWTSIRRDLAAPRPSAPFAESATMVTDLFDADVAWHLQRLRSGRGIERAILVDLDQAGAGDPGREGRRSWTRGARGRQSVGARPARADADAGGRMTVYVFTGPTLAAAAAREHLDATYLPPAAQGDVYRVARERPDGHRAHRRLLRHSPGGLAQRDLVGAPRRDPRLRERKHGCPPRGGVGRLRNARCRDGLRGVPERVVRGRRRGLARARA